MDDDTSVGFARVVLRDWFHVYQYFGCVIGTGGSIKGKHLVQWHSDSVHAEMSFMNEV